MDRTCQYVLSQKSLVHAAENRRGTRDTPELGGGLCRAGRAPVRRPGPNIVPVKNGRWVIEDTRLRRLTTSGRLIVPEHCPDCGSPDRSVHFKLRHYRMEREVQFLDTCMRQIGSI